MKIKLKNCKTDSGSSLSTPMWMTMNFAIPYLLAASTHAVKHPVHNGANSLISLFPSFFSGQHEPVWFSSSFFRTLSESAIVLVLIWCEFCWALEFSLWVRKREYWKIVKYFLNEKFKKFSAIFYDLKRTINKLY